jgi:hypothetical protein
MQVALRRDTEEPPIKAHNRGLRVAKIFVSVLLATAAIVAVAVTVWDAIRPTPTTGPGEPETFTLGTSILVAGYVLFPVLALLALGLLILALMLLAGAAAERRRAAKESLPDDAREASP